MAKANEGKPLTEGYQPRADTSRPQGKEVAAGHQPEPPAAQPGGDTVQKGYQPEASAQPEGQNPPSGGSNVAPPPEGTAGDSES